MGDSETLYDRITRKFKDNKFVVWILIAFAALLGIAQLQGALSGLKSALFPPKTCVQASASIERYDFMVGRAGPASPLAPVERDIAEIEQAADEVAREIVAAIGAVQNSSQVTLHIDHGRLHSSQPLRAAVIVVTSPMEQVGRIPRKLGETDTVDLQALSEDPQFLDPHRNSNRDRVGSSGGWS